MVSLTATDLIIALETQHKTVKSPDQVCVCICHADRIYSHSSSAWC